MNTKLELSSGNASAVGRAPSALRPRQSSLVTRHCPGFTLVELLTVIVIIGILAGLVLGAIGPVKNFVRNYRMKQEVMQLDFAMESLKTTSLGGGQYPPDSTNQQDLKTFLNRAYPRCQFSISGTTVTVTAPTGTVTQTLPSTPAQAVVFWLGGMRDANNNFIGFSANPLNPFDTTSTTGRLGPFFQFDPTRISGTTVGALTYLPQNDNTASQPFVYFKAVAGVYPATATGTLAQPYMSGTAGTTWVNPQSFQLLCPGLDGLYSAATSGSAPYYPDGTNYGVNTLDDITNFTKGAKVGSDMP